MKPRIRRQEFEAQIEARGDWTIAEWREHGREVRPCGPEWGCSYGGCQGWQLAFVKEMQWAVDRGIALPRERALLEWRPE